MRRHSREMAFKIIFEGLFTKEPSNQEFLSELKEKDQALYFDIINAYNENKTVILQNVADLLCDYEIERVYKIDLALLYCAVAEIAYVKTPPAVVINEIIEISKEYSTENSPKFINGVLSTYVKKGGV